MVCQIYKPSPTKLSCYTIIIFPNIFLDILEDILTCCQAYQKYAMYLESNANLLINGYLPHTTDLMV